MTLSYRFDSFVTYGKNSISLIIVTTFDHRCLTSHFCHLRHSLIFTRNFVADVLYNRYIIPQNYIFLLNLQNQRH